ncbi:amidohydrolase family protein [Burkholderia sp. Ax-1724]|uniref:amidohydrolase family protein n=1 Tax=Burkholderia sp. Ax-1724 TaxID=2608336 RepID=UPI0019632607|nr:amidohydrolase family protein [Burkholderia sp. Ax-1724]NIF55853.1 amidohydrolase family protein [Burkholderia sp. Ax-1724]
MGNVGFPVRLGDSRRRPRAPRREQVNRARSDRPDDSLPIPMRLAYDFRTSSFRTAAELDAWHRQSSEPALDPDLPIVDCHHHLWQRKNGDYLVDDFLADLTTGHHIRATVFVEGGTSYCEHASPALRPVGETRFAVASALAAPARWRNAICAGIVARADLMLGDQVVPVLEAQHEAAAGRLRGIRFPIRWDAAGIGMWGHTYAQGRSADRSFRAAFRHLRAFDLSFDAFVYHHQLNEIAALAGSFPETRIIVNHVGGPLGVGPYEGQRDAVFAEWKSGLAQVAAHSNVYMKLGGLGMLYTGFPFHLNAVPPGSEVLARSWAPYVHECLEAFGVTRCMFESNFPVDQQSASYSVVWNAFKRLTARCSPDEKRALFSATAAHAYRLALS